jgi:hypothetical protein
VVIFVADAASPDTTPSEAGTDATTTPALQLLAPEDDGTGFGMRDPRNLNVVNAADGLWAYWLEGGSVSAPLYRYFSDSTTRVGSGLAFRARLDLLGSQKQLDPEIVDTEVWSVDTAFGIEGPRFACADPAGSECLRVLFDPLALRAQGAGPLGLTTFDVEVATPGCGRAAVVWNGLNYLIAWWHGIGSAGLGGNCVGYDMRVARVSRSGTSLDPAGPVVQSSGGLTFPYEVVLTDGGGVSLVAWAEEVPGRVMIRAARLDASGVVLDTPAIELSQFSAEYGALSATWDGSSFVVVKGLEAVRIDPSGSVLDTTAKTLVTAGSVRAAGGIDTRAGVSVAPGEGTHWLAWIGGGSGYPGGISSSDDPDAVDTDVLAARVSLDGPAVELSAAAVSPEPARQGTPCLARGREGYLAAWIDGRGHHATGTLAVYATALDASGNPLGSSPMRLSTPRPSRGIGRYERPAVAWNGEVYLVAWVESDGAYSEDLLVARVSASGELIDQEAVVLREGAALLRADVAAMAGGWLVSARNATAGTTEIIRLAANLTPVGTVTLPDSTVASMASGGSDARVAWSSLSSSGVRVARIGADTRLLDPEGVPVPGIRGPEFELAWAAGRYFLLGEGDDNTMHACDLGASELSSDPPCAILPSRAFGPNDLGGPFGVRAADVGEHLLVTWHSGGPSSAMSSELFGVWIDLASGDLAASEPVALAGPTSSGAARWGAPASGPNGSALIVFQSFDDDPFVNTFRIASMWREAPGTR